MGRFAMLLHMIKRRNKATLLSNYFESARERRGTLVTSRIPGTRHCSPEYLPHLVMKRSFPDQLQTFNDNYQQNDGEVFYNDDFELNENDNIDYHESDITESVERDDYHDDAYDQLLTAELLSEYSRERPHPQHRTATGHHKHE